MEQARSRSYNFFKITLVSYFSVFLICISLSQLAGEDDLFWYLSTGRYIVQHGIVPSADVFGFTTTGMLWIPFEWAWDIINYFLFVKFGYTALGILVAVLVLLSFFLLYRLLSKFKIDSSLLLIFLLILSFGIMPRLSVKPHLISYLCFTLLLTIIINYRYFNKGSSRILYFLPLIFLVWANMHMGVIAGMLIIGIFLLSEMTELIFSNNSRSPEVKRVNRRELLIHLTIFIICIAATMVNPHGIKTYEYAFKLASLKHLEMINEWASPFSSNYVFKSYNFVYYFFVLGLIPVIYYSFRKKDFFPALLNMAFFVYSVRANRFTIDFMFISLLFFAVSVHFILSKKQWSSFYSVIQNNIAFKIVLSLFLLFLIIGAMNNSVYRWTGYPRKFGFGIDPGNFPVAMFKFIKETRLTESGSKPFNTYETGGYFIWNFPDKQNFIGSRSIDDKVWNDYTKIINIQPGFESRIDSLKIDYFIWTVPLVNYAQTPQLLNFGILSYLFTEKDKWKLLYWDDRSFLFVKNTPFFDQQVMRYEYRYLTPFNFYFRKDIIEKGIAEEKESVLRELTRKHKEDPYGRFQLEMTREYKDRLEN